MIELNEADRRFLLADLGSMVVFHNPGTGRDVRLDVLKVIAPCTPFSQFCTRQPDLSGHPLKETLQFLHDGMRGFLVALPDLPYASINVGDQVLIAGD